ncbi:unnamed protein product [Acanthoscelides obtectus]|uniref:Actin-related protein 5 n=1 Tax=Acanthoscelides obtectus TaxID=200917 RepID=A0A9P0JRH7_ACAOB|nr:unnamed protein product [Acanthoscelides obtectus]CAK1671283.1 Actin-related protein 5 [Acanthoscelides obtectus]
MEVFHFKDAKIVPDIVHTYSGDIRANSVPLIYDNGSYVARVGWATSKEPLLMFKNLIAKPRKERSKKDNVEPAQAPQLQVGNDILNIEAVRFQLKTQFDRNIVTHFEAQEHLFDYAFTHLGIDSENRVNHPIVLTEAFLNPNTSRQLEQQKERKRELARRLTEINARKREERLAEDQEKLRQLLEIQEIIDFGAEKQEIENLLAEVQMKNLQELQKTVTNLNMRIERTRQKIIAASSAEDTEEPPVKQTKLSKMVFESDTAMHSFIDNVKKMRQEILTKKMLRKQRKQDIFKRRTAAGQERMRIISQLARKEKGNDDFGLRDEDWDIYKTISKDGGDSDSEAENEKLMEFEEILRNHEPEEFDSSANPGETHQLHVGIERFRAAELIFKPYMAGSSEAGLSEVIGYVLTLFSPDEQLRLAKNVIITGGLANLKGLKERILKDLISIRPFQSEVSVSVMKDCSLSPWYGMKQFARSEEYKKYIVTKKMYEEYGGEYFKTHLASNPYFVSPKETMVDVDT